MYLVRLAALFIAFLATAPPVTAELLYQITNLGTLGGGYSSASAINDQGWVVGVSAIPTGQHRAYLWCDGVMVELGVLPYGQHSQASALNNTGWVVGASQPGRGIAVLWVEGRMKILGGSPLFGEGFYAYGVNNRGQVVGGTVGNFHSDAWLWQDGVLTRLPAPGKRASARAINDFGLIAGSASVSPGGFLHAALWFGDAFMELGTLGGVSSSGQAVNNRAQVAGVSDTAAGLRHAFVWDWQLGMRDLGVLPGHRNSVAEALNDRGQVVGWSWATNTAQSRAALWQNGEIADLTKLISAGSRWQFTHAFGINNRGQIVGMGRYEGRTRGFLLTPVRSALPVPSQRLPNPRP